MHASYLFGMGPASPYVTWRVRAAAIAAASFVCLALAALLVAASNTRLRTDQPRAGVEALIEIAPQRRDRPQPPRRVRAPHASAPSDAPASIETQMFARLLSCLDRRFEDRPRDCPREPPPSEWEEPPIAVGGDFAPPPGVDLEVIYTRAELQTLVMPALHWRLHSCRPSPAPAKPFGGRNLPRRKLGRAVRAPALSGRGCHGHRLKLGRAPAAPLLAAVSTMLPHLGRTAD